MADIISPRDLIRGLRDRIENQQKIPARTGVIAYRFICASGEEHDGAG